MDVSEQTTIDLEAGSEWRFELEGDETIAVRVHSQDRVYINSQEIPPATWYPIHRNTKSAIYAPTPARVEVSPLPISQYTSTSTTQPQLINLHLALERIRLLAKRNLSSANGASPNGPSRGPRVMVIGPPSSGKTTVVKNLVNMALGSGMGWSVGVVGLDPASASHPLETNLIPGCLSLSTPISPLPTHHLAHPLGSPPSSVPASTLSADVATLGWWYGHLEPANRGTDIWRKLVTTMGERWRERCEKDPIGLFVDTSSAFTNPMLGTRKDDPKARYSLLAQAIECFEIDVLLVLGHEKLTIDLDRLLSPRGVRVLRIPKSGGAVDLDDTFRQSSQAFQIRAYFYGEPSLPKEISSLVGRSVARETGLSPYSFQIGWETLTILRVGEENAAPSSALPIGSTHALSPTRLTRVNPSGPAHVVRLLNTVLAIVAIKPEDRLKKDDVKQQAVKSEGEESEVKQEEGGKEEATEIEEADEDDVPFREEIGWREVFGFIVITAIDAQRKKYTVLSPSPGKLPSTVAIAGSLEWVDSE
ncbi:MAG: Cleavage polyadenylation factor subunit clp1 [Tremellales sp. Tagirdzhanova-0007]|nr:MAG: Cleavage polyadenylation factor subunit clp1 [Tremellales sp. Tagirdzhanova-0007]